MPDTRAQVFEQCVDLLLYRWELERSISVPDQKSVKSTILDRLGISRSTLDQALSEIAYKAHEERQADDRQKREPTFVTEELLTGVLNAYIQDLSKVESLLDYCQGLNGLLMLQGSALVANASAETPSRHIYAFCHPMFEEFLAAQYVYSVLMRGGIGNLKRELMQRDDRWREVIIMLGEYLCFVQKNQGVWKS